MSKSGVTNEWKLWIPTHCLVCGSDDIEYRRYGFDPMFVHIACFNCVQVHTVRCDVEEIVLED